MRRGFTLIELLAVIVILGIILAIAVPSVVGIIERSKEQTFEKQLILIEDATRKYITFSHETVEWETDPYDSESKTAKVTLKDLQSAGLFDGRLKNPKGGEFSPEETVVLVTKKGVNYSYEVLTPGDPTPTFCFTFDPDRQMIIDYDAENPVCTSDVIIPKEINGVAVREIGVEAFYKKQLTSVVIPNSVTTIGNWAFENNQLTSVVIPNSVTTIGAFAFADNQLTSITIPSGIDTIEFCTFSGNQLTSVTIPSNVTTIENCAFENNQLTSITIPNSVVEIGYSALSGNRLTSITVPSSVTSIGTYAFCNNQLTKITMQGGNTTIGHYLLNFSNNNFRETYYAGGAGTYVGTQNGTWTKE